MLIVMTLVAGLAMPVPGPERLRVMQPEPAQARLVSSVDQLWQALDLQALMPIFRDEAVAEAIAMEDEGLVPRVAPPWPEVVARVHDVERLEELFRSGIGRALAARDPSAVRRGLAFYETHLGRRLLDLEIAARRAMLDDEVEAQAHDGFNRALGRGDGRAQQILRLIDEADLVSPNVAGALNASLAFSRGFEEGGGFDMPLTDRQMLAETWAQRDQVEFETTRWLRSFLMLSYSSLSDDEMEAYMAYAASREGRAVARVLFDAFDAVLQRTSFELGLAAALRMQGREL